MEYQIITGPKGEMIPFLMVIHFSQEEVYYKGVVAEVMDDQGNEKGYFYLVLQSEDGTLRTKLSQRGPKNRWVSKNRKVLPRITAKVGSLIDEAIRDAVKMPPSFSIEDLRGLQLQLATLLK